MDGLDVSIIVRTQILSLPVKHQLSIFSPGSSVACIFCVIPEILGAFCRSNTRGQKAPKTYRSRLS